jgi:hypothetical protein
MSVLPAPFGFGIWTSHVTPTVLGAPCVLMDRFDADECGGDRLPSHVLPENLIQLLDQLSAARLPAHRARTVVVQVPFGVRDGDHRPDGAVGELRLLELVEAFPALDEEEIAHVHRVAVDALEYDVAAGETAVDRRLRG